MEKMKGYKLGQQELLIEARDIDEEHRGRKEKNQAKQNKRGKKEGGREGSVVKKKRARKRKRAQNKTVFNKLFMGYLKIRKYH